MKIKDGKYLVLSPNGETRTFRVRTQESAANQLARNPNKAPFCPDAQIIGLLTGEDCTNFAFVNDNGIKVWRSKQGNQSNGKQKSLFEKYAQMFWDLMTVKNGFFAKLGYTVEEETPQVKRTFVHPPPANATESELSAYLRSDDCGTINEIPEESVNF
jgi:hypothetical protein